MTQQTVPKPSPAGGRGLGEGGPTTSATPQQAPWQATILTLFPEMFPGPLAMSLAGRALAANRWTLTVKNIRESAPTPHRSVDDTPFGGGPGMVMRPDILDAAIREAAPAERPLIYLTPRGTPLRQSRIRALAAGPGVTLICGRYEGIDQRVLDARNVEELSIGDYVLSGGELPALVLLDACIRLLPGTMGAAESAADESFSDPAGNLLEYPHYTRPAEWQGRAVPPVLLTGHHAAIAAWRRTQSEHITRTRRPDLWRAHMDNPAPAP